MPTCIGPSLIITLQDRLWHNNRQFGNRSFCDHFIREDHVGGRSEIHFQPDRNMSALKPIYLYIYIYEEMETSLFQSQTINIEPMYVYTLDMGSVALLKPEKGYTLSYYSSLSQYPASRETLLASTLTCITLLVYNPRYYPSQDRLPRWCSR